MSEMDRREFVKRLVLGGAALGLTNILWPNALAAAASRPADIGACKSVKVIAVSEVGWWDDDVLLTDGLSAGGPMAADQWKDAWTLENGAGSSSLIEVVGLDGKVRRILLDSGWNASYMTWRFQRSGVDKLLKNKELECLVISHEHSDHLWGIQAALSMDPKVTLLMSSTVRPEALQFVAGRTFASQGAINAVKHQGKLKMMKPGGVHKLFDGAASVVFDTELPLKVRGEQSLIFNIQGKGLVLVSGCCHQTINTFADFARSNVKGGEKLYGLYGGLHIAPFGGLDPFQKKIVKSMGNYGFKKMACNHCTGLESVKMMKDLGYPVVGGRGREGSTSNLYVGNGDSVVFG